jgi:hypothetical protein
MKKIQTPKPASKPAIKKTVKCRAAEVGHRSCTMCLLGSIAMQLGRKLRWNPDLEQFVDDPEADRLLTPPMRAPWRA